MVAQPELGWAWLSQRERQAAERALADDGADGTRDELGFGVIHFAYADRFFPGTSVQQTSIRYVWFVIWNYLQLADSDPGGRFPAAKLNLLEDRIGRKLLKHYGLGDGHGIIGGRVLRVGRSPATKPSAVYWNALRSWGLLSSSRRTGHPPGRSELHGAWAQLTDRGPRPEVDADRQAPIFVDPPQIPSGWRHEHRAIDFTFDPAGQEAVRLRRAWAEQRDQYGRSILLSRLADGGLTAPPSLTSPAVLSLCTPDEKISLRRAQRAGALAAIARALHTWMVQKLKLDPDQRAASRAWLDDAVTAYASAASKLDVEGLKIDVPDLGDLAGLIEATQAWLADGAGDPNRLEPIYRAREMTQKPGRALLAPSSGDRRAVWTARERGPLTYRWAQVSRFLNELAVA